MIEPTLPEPGGDVSRSVHSYNRRFASPFLPAMFLFIADAQASGRLPPRPGFMPTLQDSGQRETTVTSESFEACWPAIESGTERSLRNRHDA